MSQFNWSDAWLLLAISIASADGPANLEAIIVAGDSINFSIFNANELESGLVRLTEAGYIVESGGSFSVTEKTTSHSDSVHDQQLMMGKRLRNVQELLGTAEAADEQPCANNLKYPGFSVRQFEEAVQRYQGYLR